MRKLLLTVAAAAVCLVPQSSVAQIAPPNSNGISWGHVHMFVNDPDAMKKLFVDVLGGQVANEGRLELVKVSGAMIIMSKAQVAPTEGSEGSTLNHFTLKVKNVADTKAKLVAAGATVVSEKPKSVMMMFPEKVQVEFVEDAAVKAPVVFRNVQINAVDPNALRAWYLKTFPGGVTGTEAGMLTATWPAGQIDFMKVSSPQAATKGRSLDHMGFEIVGLEAFCKKLESDPTVKFDTTYREMAALGGLKLAYIVDPEGTRIELTEGFGSK